MRHRDIPYSLFAGLIGMALVLWWLAELMAPPPEDVKPEAAHSIDYYAMEFVRTEMKPDGSPKSRLSALAMGHYEDTNVSELTSPVMMFFNEAAPPWIVRSEEGSISGDGNTIFLKGKATLDREQAGAARALEVVSKNVTVRMDSKQLDSAEFTEIYNPPHYTSGTGMHADFSDGMKVTLLNDVQGRYAF